MKIIEQEYFDNFPYDESIVRLFLKALQKRGWYKGVDIDNEKLSDMISSPDGGGPRIIALTKDSGTHYSSMYVNGPSFCSHEVKEGETYITFNTMRVLSGDCTTYVMKDGEIVNGYLLAMS